MEERNIFYVVGATYFYYTLVMIPVTEINDICIAIEISFEPISDSTYLVNFNHVTSQTISPLSDNELDNEELNLVATTFATVIEHHLDEYSVEDNSRLQRSKAITYFVI